MADILPRELPAASTVNPAASIIADSGTIVERATPLQLVDSARPLASQADAETGVNNVKIMSPLRVGQAVSKTLSDPDAATRISYRNSSIASKLDQSVCHLDFGGIPDYSFSTGAGTDNGPAILAAANNLVSRYGGGRVVIMGRCRIASNVILPKGVSLWAPAPPPDFLYAGLIALWPHTLYVDPTVAITLDSGTSVENMLICRTGLQVNTTYAQTVAQFTGTPLVMRAGSVGVRVQSCMVLGFNRMFDCEDLTQTYSYGRAQLLFNRFDCLNGIRFHNMGDKPLLLYNEGWPFLTTGSVVEPNEGQNARPGIGIELTGYQGFTLLQGNLTYDYLIGRQVNGNNASASAGSIRFSNEEIDAYPNAVPKGQIGYNIINNAYEISIVDPLIESQDTGIQVITSNLYGIRALRVENPLLAEIKQNAVNVISGDVDIIDPQIRNVLVNTPNGITNTGTGRVRVRDGIWTGSQTYAYARETGSSGPLEVTGNPIFNSTFTNAVYVNPYKRTAAAATTIMTKGDEIELYVSGATTIQSLQNPSGFTGRQITLIAATALAVGGAGNILTPGNAVISIPINSRVTLSSDGTNFYLSM